MGVCGQFISQGFPKLQSKR